MNYNFTQLKNSPESKQSSLFGVVTHNVVKNDSGLFSVFDDRVSRKFWLKADELFLSEYEELALDKVAYKGKTFGRNKKAKKAAIIVISLVRKLSKNNKTDAHLSRDILGKLLKSNATADHVLNSLIVGNILKHNNFSNRENKVARKWKLKLFGLGEYLNDNGLKKRAINTTGMALETNFETFVDEDTQIDIEEPREAFCEQIEPSVNIGEFEIDFPEESVIVFEESPPITLNNRTMNTRNQELDLEESNETNDYEYQQKLMRSSLSPYFKKRFESFGIDIYGESYCDCCDQKLPNALFSIRIVESYKENARCVGI